MLKKLIIIIVVALVAFSVVAAMQPSEFNVTRTATMNAPASSIFSQVNDFHKWQAWSPWAKLDPDAKNNYSGEQVGVGSVLSWSGNSKVGEGSMTITESRLNETIKMKLDFTKPFTATHSAEFNFVSKGDNQTEVTWSMYGSKNFIAKAMGLIFNCEKMVGAQFEEGLANIQAIVETPAAVETPAVEVPAVETPAEAPSAEEAPAAVPGAETPAEGAVVPGAEAVPGTEVPATETQGDVVPNTEAPAATDVPAAPAGGSNAQ